MNARNIAIKSIIDILENKITLLSLDSSLSKHDISDSDRSYIKALAYEFFRKYYSLENIVNNYIDNKTKQTVKILLMIGALQILEFKQPDYAVVNETVNSCKNLKILWAKKLVNGVLRNIIRNIDTVKNTYNNSVNKDIPIWLSDTLQKQYGDDSNSIIKALNTKAPMFVRVNEKKDTTKLYEHFKTLNISYETTTLPNCLKLDSAIDVKNDRLFLEGYFSIQDISAQYAGHIVKQIQPKTLLDACAAPGGKTTHILETTRHTDITTIDILDKRLKLLEENIQRVDSQTKVKTIKYDLTQALENKFDMIVLDTPCSAVGTIRRNPDIKLSRTPKDITEISHIQSQILSNLWDNNLNDNGYLLYITCSILEQENQNQINNFLANRTNAQVIDISILDKYKSSIGYQILPEDNLGDGFYYCLLKKVS